MNSLNINYEKAYNQRHKLIFIVKCTYLMNIALSIFIHTIKNRIHTAPQI